MLGQRARILNQVFVAATLAIGLLAYQNCSKLKVNSEDQTTAPKNNGGIYGGKPYRHYQNHQCADGSFLEGEILYSSTAFLTRENCEVVSPARELQPSEYQLTSAGLQFGNRIFVASDPEFVQNKARISNGALTANISTVTFDQPTQPGHLLLCMIEFKDPSRSIQSVTGSSGAAFSPINQVSSINSQWITSLWYLENAPIETSVSVNFTGPTDESTLDCFEYGGIATANALEGQIAVDGSGSPDVNLSNVSEGSLVFYYFVIEGSEVASPAPGFTTRSAIQDNIAGDLVAAAAGTYSAAPGPSPASWNLSMVAFRRSAP
ncbi:MAG: hypothetical protein AB7F86_05285 [Bdellovibrionales bacterium]